MKNQKGVPVNVLNAGLNAKGSPLHLLPSPMQTQGATKDMLASTGHVLGTCTHVSGGGGYSRSRGGLGHGKVKQLKQSALIWIFLLCSASFTYAQLIVDKGIYKANFSNTFHQPRWVSYTLFKGGGDCPRDGFSFKNDDSRLETATDADYSHNGYDKGHLANAEDFAFDCTKDEFTFRYYNCLPQTANLNRGIWKRNETAVRKWSQKEKLYIICGGYFGNKKMGNTTVPNDCWKVVQSVATKKVLFCGWFSNTDHATLDTLTITELEKKLKTKIILVK